MGDGKWRRKALRVRPDAVLEKPVKAAPRLPAGLAPMGLGPKENTSWPRAQGQLQALAGRRATGRAQDLVTMAAGRL